MSGEPRLITPLITSSPSFIERGMLSPVIEEVSKVDFPLITFPSIGTLSPDLTINKSPVFTSKGSTIFSISSLYRVTLSGLKLRIDLIEFLLLSTAYFSNRSPI